MTLDRGRPMIQTRVSEFLAQATRSVLALGVSFGHAALITLGPETTTTPQYLLVPVGSSTDRVVRLVLAEHRRSGACEQSPPAWF